MRFDKSVGALQCLADSGETYLRPFPRYGVRYADVRSLRKVDAQRFGLTSRVTVKVRLVNLRRKAALNFRTGRLPRSMERFI